MTAPAPPVPPAARRPAIVTLTPNPSVDLLFEAGRLVWDDANRVAMPRRRPGGQGINIVRAARALGGRAEAVAPFGGVAGRELREALAAEGTPHRPVPIAGETRVFVGVRETETGRSLLVNPRGPSFSEQEGEALLAALAESLDEQAPVGWLAACGSLPPGLPVDFHARAGRIARDRGIAFVPDCDGAALAAAAAAGCDLLVPNSHEAARLLATACGDVPAGGRAAPALLRYGARLGVITLGHLGAVAASPSGVWHARSPARTAGSAVGAGDAFLAALLLALIDGAEAPEALLQAVAAGAAVLRGTGATLLRAEDFAEACEDVALTRLR
jgi:6-phosphofructokinase 2